MCMQWCKMTVQQRRVPRTASLGVLRAAKSKESYWTVHDLATRDHASTASPKLAAAALPVAGRPRGCVVS